MPQSNDLSEQRAKQKARLPGMPLTRAEQENVAYVGELGNRETERLLLRGKLPEAGLKRLKERTEDLASRAAGIAQEEYSGQHPRRRPLPSKRKGNPRASY